MATKKKATKIKLKDPLMESLNRDREYTSRSLDEVYRHTQEIERAPLDERREAREAFYEAMARDPALVAERIGWIFNGSYGHGEMLKAKQVIANPRMNRRAALTHLVGMFEWRCPGNFAAEAWKKLTSAQKQTLDAAVDVVIEEAEKELAEEQGA